VLTVLYNIYVIILNKCYGLVAGQVLKVNHGESTDDICSRHGCDGSCTVDGR